MELRSQTVFLKKPKVTSNLKTAFFIYPIVSIPKLLRKWGGRKVAFRLSKDFANAAKNKDCKHSDHETQT